MGHETPPTSEAAPDDRMLCYCKAIRYGEVRATIEAIDAKCVEQVTAACTAGGGCRTCHPEIQDLIDVHRGRKPKSGWRKLWERMFTK